MSHTLGANHRITTAQSKRVWIYIHISSICIYLSVCLSIYLSILLPIYRPTQPPFYPSNDLLSTYLSIYLSTYLPTYLPVHLLHLSIDPSTYPPIYRSIHHPSIDPSIDHRSIDLSIYRSIENPKVTQKCFHEPYISKAKTFQYVVWVRENTSVLWGFSVFVCFFAWKSQIAMLQTFLFVEFRSLSFFLFFLDGCSWWWFCFHRLCFCAPFV